MDADLSHPPDAISAIVEKLTEYPVVIGSRYTRGGRVERWGALRRILSRLANYYAQILTGLPASDLTSGFVGYRTEALKSVDLHSIKLDGYAFQIEIKYALYRARQFLYEIPITFIERREGQSKMSWKIIFEGALFPIKILFSRIW